MPSDPADPFAVFGLTERATLTELRVARRELAKHVHPDIDGGDGERMQAINRAFDLAVKRLRAEPFLKSLIADPAFTPVLGQY